MSNEEGKGFKPVISHWLVKHFGNIKILPDTFFVLVFSLPEAAFIVVR
jgi:hypothetical protein